MKNKIMTGFMVAIMIMAVVLPLSPQAEGAKKVSLSKSKVNVPVGTTVKIKVKNGNKKAKVTWKIASKKVAKIVKKSYKGKSAYATVKGVSKGKTNLSAAYKLGKNKAKKLKCTVVVNEAANGSDNQNNNTPVTSAQPNDQGANPTLQPTADATPQPTEGATAEPTAKPAGEKTIEVISEGIVEIPLRDEFRKTDGAGNYLTDTNGNFIPVDEYSQMNTKARFDSDAGVVYCESANNIIFYLPDDFYAETGDTVDYEITGTYDANSDSGKGFRVWLVDTIGKDPSLNVSSGDPITTSDQIIYNRNNGNLTLNNNEFTVKGTLESKVSESDVEKGEKSNGISSALTVKASSWNGMFGDLKITSVKITVKKK